MQLESIISIITPSFNQGKFIEKTLRSVIFQKGDFWIDFVIMDGGSKDQSVEIIQNYEEQLRQFCEKENHYDLQFYVNRKDSEFLKCLGVSYRWKSEKDKGQSDALSKGFSKGIGRIFAWINSDDNYISDDVFQHVFSHFDSKTEVLVGDTIALDSNGTELWRQKPPKPTIFSMLYKQIAPPQPAVFFTQSLFQRVGGLNETLRYVMDIDLWFRFLFAKAKFKKVEKLYAIQVYHEDAKSLEGGGLFAAFQPEDKAMKKQYKLRLGNVHYLYQFFYILYKIAYRTAKFLLRR
ncbi:glycosyltransferase family 2 protein [Leptospira sp. WS92.C1]